MLLWLLVGCTGDETCEDCPGDTSPPADTDTSPPPDTGTAAAAPAVFINELLAANETTLPVAVKSGTIWPDWIELHNAGEEAVSLAGMSISDDRDEPGKHTFDETLSIEPGGFLLLLASGEPSHGAAHLGFKLSQEGEEVALYAESGQRIDLVVFDEQAADIAAARAADGDESAGWVYLWAGTPGESNAAH